MKLNFKHIAALCALLLPLCMEGNAQGPLHKIKDRKRLERENELLRQRVKDLEEELLLTKLDSIAKDSLENRLEALYEEDESRLATGLHPEEYDANVTDSLLSIWYLHREVIDNHEDDGFNMDSVHYRTDVPDSMSAPQRVLVRMTSASALRSFTTNSFP